MRYRRRKISRRRKHLYEYSICRNNFGNAGRATYRASFNGRKGKGNRPPQNIVGRAWPSVPGTNEIKRGRGRSTERRYFGNHRVGPQFAAWALRSETTERFRNQFFDLQNTHRWAKLGPMADGEGQKNTKYILPYPRIRSSPSILYYHELIAQM